MKFRYSRLFSLGNYENEKLEIEREYPDDMPTLEAYKLLRAELFNTREEFIAEEKAEAEEARRQDKVRYAEDRLKRAKEDVNRCKKELSEAKAGLEG